MKNGKKGCVCNGTLKITIGKAVLVEGAILTIPNMGVKQRCFTPTDKKLTSVYFKYIF
jgi:hypothetical protein